MHLIYGNVNDAFYGIVSAIYRGTDRTKCWGDELDILTERKPSRAGETLQVTEPVLLTYEKPRQRVLFNSARDANPFFHMFESLWMLAGRNDVAPLEYYSSKIGDIASDDGKTFNGAYGYRWRHADNSGASYYSEVDQLNVLIDHLKANPESRRAVLQMWDVENDLLKIDSTKDVCCNTAAYFSIRKVGWLDPVVADPWTEGGDDSPVLDMTVTNRSNDLIWGMLGANAVHFSFLQEYVACALGIGVGRYNQFTNNLHVYVERWKPKEWIAAGEVQPGGIWCEGADYPLLVWKEDFDTEVGILTSNYEGAHRKTEDELGLTEPWLIYNALPMMQAFSAWKEDRDEKAAFNFVQSIKNSAWRMACDDWIYRRVQASNRKG